MSNKKLCPMAANSPGYSRECQEDRCAWWVEEGEDNGRCAIVRLAVNLDNLADATVGGVVDVRTRQ